ncbi:MAG TPA: circadian clock KaiB family protein [Bacteroidales bacterium]
MNDKKIVLRLYIIEKSRGHLESVDKLNHLLNSKFDSCYTLEVIDILKNPEMTIKEGILASPTLIRVEPLPPKRIIGSLLNKDVVEELELSDCS